MAPDSMESNEDELLESTQTGKKHKNRFAGSRDLGTASSRRAKKPRLLYEKDGLSL